MAEVTVVDYGCNNILSLIRALEYNGAKVKVAVSEDDISNADRLILPGVGAFRASMTALKKKGFDNATFEFAKKGRPFLGICVGMQLMFQESEEFGLSRGLGIIDGKIKKIPSLENGVKIPNIGWCSLIKSPKQSGSILEGSSENEEVYFVHSFGFLENSENVVATISYGGTNICAVVQKENSVGFQYHPEKSGSVGLKHLKKFLEL